MDGSYFQNPTFPTIGDTLVESNLKDVKKSLVDVVDEKNLAENIFKLNKGKKVRIYIKNMDNDNSNEGFFSGTFEQTGKDYFIISNPENGYFYLIPFNNINYIRFDEDIIFTK